MRSRKIIASLLILIVTVAAYFFINNYINYHTYVLKYQDIIQEMSGKYNLDPYLVCAVIYTESKFNSEAESPAGAIGLMQIMPSTSSWIAQKSDIEGYVSDDDLTNPEMSIQMGGWYLNYLFDRFDGSLDLVLAAYNAGPQKVTTWLSDEAVSSDGKTLTNIPYKETANYIEKVRKAYDKYKNLYKEEFTDRQ